MNAPVRTVPSAMLIAAARSGVTPTREAKIRSVTSIEELMGFQKAVVARGERLTTEEVRAVSDMRNVLRGAP